MSDCLASDCDEARSLSKRKASGDTRREKASRLNKIAVVSMIRTLAAAQCIDIDTIGDIAADG